MSTATTTEATPTSVSKSSPAFIVKTDKCLIRAYKRSDAQALADAANHPEIVEYMRNSFPNPYTIKSAEYWIDFALKGDPMLNFVICSLDDTPIGGIGLVEQHDIEFRNYELGYWVGLDHWGKGIASSAAKGFSFWAFKQFPDLLRLEAGVFSGNTGSMKVLERIGYTKEGVRRKAICKRSRNGKDVKDTVFDQTIYSLLREEADKLA